RLQIQLENVLVAGDSASDAEMFLLHGVKGVVVENALPELRSLVEMPGVFFAPSPMAAGVLEGLHYFGVIAEVPAMDALPTPESVRSIS
ncbi:MAG: HAD family hydrolase, partial [Opitutaceae bacterium]